MDLAFDVLGLVVIAIPFLYIPIRRLTTWWLDGVIDGATAIGGVLMFILLLGAIVTAPLPLRVLALGVVIVGAVVLPLIGKSNDEAVMRKIEDDRLDAYISKLESDPMDPAARIALADQLGRRGHYDKAIEHLEWVLQQFPRLHPTVKPRLDGLMRERERPEHLDIIFCHECRAENPLGAQRCSECGATFSLAVGFAEGFRRVGGPTAILRAWIVLGVAVPLIIFALLEVDTVIAAPIVLAIVAASAWLFLRWVGGDLGKPVD